MDPVKHVRPRLSRPFRPRASRAPAVARRLRPAARRGRPPRQARAAPRRPVADAPEERAPDRASRRATTAACRSRPTDAYGDDQLWWLDRMVRTNAPLIERMTLVWHDWFATSNDGVGSQRLMMNQNQMLRRHALGLVPRPAARRDEGPGDADVALRRSSTSKGAPNENYARELMELFTLGADRGATPSRTCASRRARSPAGRAEGRRPADASASAPSGTTTGARRSSARPATSTGATRASSA